MHLLTLYTTSPKNSFFGTTFLKCFFHKLFPVICWNSFWKIALVFFTVNTTCSHFSSKKGQLSRGHPAFAVSRGDTAGTRCAKQLDRCWWVQSWKKHTLGPLLRQANWPDFGDLWSCMCFLYCSIGWTITFFVFFSRCLKQIQVDEKWNWVQVDTNCRKKWSVELKVRCCFVPKTFLFGSQTRRVEVQKLSRSVSGSQNSKCFTLRSYWIW